jgi:hypothetical protein
MEGNLDPIILFFIQQQQGLPGKRGKFSFFEQRL